MIGENFPYTNFHDMNLDWIIKIAKDFLDQYTSIQTMISEGEESLAGLTEDGLQQLQDKADALEEALQAWYTEHSEDIAGQLADAIADLNEWYNQHIDAISTELASAISAFGSSAEAKGEEVLESIPADYTLLGHKVTELENYTGIHTKTATANNRWPYVTVGSISAGEYRITLLDETSDNINHNIAVYVDSEVYANNLPLNDEHTYTLPAGTLKFSYVYESIPDNPPELTYQVSKVGNSATILERTYKNSDLIENINNELGYFPDVQSTANSKWPYLLLGNVSGGSKYRIRINSIVTDDDNNYYLSFVDDNSITYATGLQIGEEYIFTLAGNATSARLNFLFENAPTITPIITYEFSKISDDSIIGMITAQKFATIIVAADGSGQFTKISDAVTWAKNHAGVNRWGDIWFKIYVKSGTYIEEPYDGWPYAPIYIHGFKCILTGEDRDTTIIQLTNTSGHDNRVIDVRAEAIIENFTIKCLKDNTYTSLGNNAYVIHNDGSPSPAPNYNWKTVIRNCVLISECSQPIGAGLQDLQTQIYENLTCILENDATVTDGALYIHGPQDDTAIPNGVIIDGCTLINNNDGQALIMPNVSGSLPFNSIDVTIRRTITCTSGATEINPQFKTSHRLTKDSKLNSNEYLNY